MGLAEDLKKDIAESRLVVVVGAGVSVQATDRAECASWTGLLRNGASHCADLNLELKDRWLGIVQQEIESGDLDDLLSAAEKVTAKLGGRAYGRRVPEVAQGICWSAQAQRSSHARRHSGVGHASRHHEL